jgi:hypothetical protein
MLPLERSYFDLIGEELLNPVADWNENCS